MTRRPSSTLQRHAAGSGAARASLAAVETPNKRLAGSTKDILLSLPEDLKDRMISTIAWSRPYTGIGHQQKFIRKAIQELCERLETELNDGKPFPRPSPTQTDPPSVPRHPYGC